MALKLLITSDLHLGRRSSGLPSITTDASAITTWNRLVELSVSRNVDGILVAGDVIDQENMFFESVGPLLNGIKKLTEQNITLFFVAGNHDYNTLTDAVQQTNSPAVHLLGRKGEWERKILENDNSELQIFGRSFTSSHMSTDPLESFKVGEVDPTIPSIGIVHGEVDATESKYGPIDRNRLLESPIHAWFIGHIHKPQILREESPLICYPGSPHAFSSSEPGRHGPWILEFDKEEKLEPKQIPLSPVRFETVEINLSGIEDKHDFRQKVLTQLMELTEDYGAELDPIKHLVYDVRLTGSTNDPGSLEDWKSEIVDYTEKITEQEVEVSVRKVKSELSPAIENLEAWANQNNPAGVLADLLLKLRNEEEDELIDDLVDQWQVKTDQLNRADIYRPLKRSDQHVLSNASEARKYMQSECERLLIQLIRQQQTKEE